MFSHLVYVFNFYPFDRLCILSLERNSCVECKIFSLYMNSFILFNRINSIVYKRVWLNFKSMIVRSIVGHNIGTQLVWEKFAKFQTIRRFVNSNQQLSGFNYAKCILSCHAQRNFSTAISIGTFCYFYASISCSGHIELYISL